MNGMIQELRKENQNLKQANYEFELRVKGTNFTEDKVDFILFRSRSSTMKSID